MWIFKKKQQKSRDFFFAAGRKFILFLDSLKEIVVVLKIVVKNNISCNHKIRLNTYVFVGNKCALV